MRKIFYALTFLFIIIVIGNTVIVAQKDMKPPIAKKETKITKVNGVELKDDYYWLRDRNKEKNPAILEYLNAENKYTKALWISIKGLLTIFTRKCSDASSRTTLRVPYKKGDFWYFTKTEEGKQYPVYYRSKAKDGKDAEVLFDQNAMAEGFKYFAIGEFDVSDDGNMLAFATDTTGYRQYTLQFKDLRTGEIYPEKIERVTSVAWANDNKTVFYVTEEEVEKRSNELFAARSRHDQKRFAF